MIFRLIALTVTIISQQHFYVDIVTPHISNFAAHHITPDSIGFFWTGVFDNVVIEYGKKDFIPGTDTTLGISGTVINNAISPATIFGLSQDSVRFLLQG